MKRLFLTMFVVLLVVGVLAATSRVGQAFPGRDSGDCTSCHNGGGLAYDVAPPLVTLKPGESGQFDFDITALASEEGALVVRGLNDAGLDLASVGAGWTEQNPTSNQYYQNEPITGLGIVPLSLSIGAGAALGEYNLTAQFVGQGQRGVTDPSFLGFTLRVIPEPATFGLVMAGLGVLCLGLGRRRRRAA